MNTSKRSLLNFIQEVHPMPQLQAETIIGYFHEKRLEKNELLFKEGKVCNEYHFLEEGLVRSYTYDNEGNDVTTGFYSSNQVVTDIFSLFKQVPSKENFQALSYCQTWFITFDELQQVFHNLPHFREFGRAILVNAYAQLKMRMLSMIQETAEVRYKTLLQHNPDLFQQAPLKTIASYLGITDTSLSRIRKELSKNT